MLWPQALALTLALVPSLVSAAIFPPNTKVKMLDATSFHKVMKKNVRMRRCVHGLHCTLNKTIGIEHGCVRRAMVWCKFKSA